MALRKQHFGHKKVRIQRTETNSWPHLTPPRCRAKSSRQQTSSPSNLCRFWKSLRHGQQKRSLFEYSKTWYQWQHVHFIRAFLSNRTFQVRLGSCLSMRKRSENGTPQGSVLSPILFSMMIIYLPGLISSISSFYADYFCLWATGSNFKELEYLCQNSLPMVNHWCNHGCNLWGTLGTCLPRFFNWRGHNMPCPNPFLFQK